MARSCPGSQPELESRLQRPRLDLKPELPAAPQKENADRQSLDTRQQEAGLSFLLVKGHRPPKDWENVLRSTDCALFSRRPPLSEITR